MQTVTAIVVTRYVDIIQGRMHREVFIRNCKGYRLSDEPALICDPWIFYFFLFVVDQKLAEQTEVIIKADTVSRQSKCCDRIKEACCQTAKASVSKGRLHLHLLDLRQFSSVSSECFFYFLVHTKVDQVVGQQFSDQKLC